MQDFFHPQYDEVQVQWQLTSDNQRMGRNLDLLLRQMIIWLPGIYLCQIFQHHLVFRCLQQIPIITFAPMRSPAAAAVIMAAIFHPRSIASDSDA